MSHTEYFCNGQKEHEPEGVLKFLHDNTLMRPCDCGKKFRCPVCGNFAGNDPCDCDSAETDRMKKHFTPEPLSGSLSPDQEDFNL